MVTNNPYFKGSILCISVFLLSLFQRISAQSVSLNGSSQYVSLDNSASLHLTNFTLEAWIKIEGTGIITTSGTGSGGHTNIVPIITKGRAEAELAVQDVNYFLGYDLTTKKLLADFEDNATSLNHPVTGNTTIGNCWTHVAATYNTTTNTWKLYINGVLDQTTALGGSFTPQSLSNVNACIGSAFNSTNAVSGFFNGRIDEARIWNVVRTDAEVLANFNTQLTSGTGLVSRWGFNEGTGTTALNSIGGGPSGLLSNNPLWKNGFNQAYPFSSLDFNGTSDYVTFGPAPGLNASSFTLEAWIRIEGTGVTTATSGVGGGGFDNATSASGAVPIITKGRGEGESPANLNINYFMGLQGNKLVADFEDAAGPNHAVIGVATIPTNTWTHVAATYEPVTAVWNLYLNGVLDKTLDLGSNVNPANTSIQHAAVGTAMTSTGSSAGFFDGKIDEVRIWNVERSGANILANMNTELTSGSGLLGRWGFNEGCGLTAGNSIGGGVNGTLSSSTGPVWVTENFNELPPYQPFNPSPANNALSPSTSPTICANVSDPNGGNLTVRFYGRKKVFTPGTKFTIIGLPDTQFYTEEVPGTNSGGGGHNGIFKAQTQWIADHRLDSNVVFVVQLGDCVQNGNNPPGSDKQIEWKRADTSMKKIENPNVPIPDGIPYGICVGNHDQGVIGDPNSTNTFYNQYFGESRFTGRGYYGGHYSTNNDNHFELFSAEGIDFIHISIEYFPDGTTSPLQQILDWADNLLKTYPDRKGIVSSHNMLGTGNPASFQGPGQKIYDDLKDNPNLILMLAGHVAGEGRRTDVFGGNTVHTLMADYQSGYSNGGNGYLRIMQFIPDQNLLSVKTYSPYSNTSFIGSGSQFTLPVNLSQPYTLIGTNLNVTSGTSSCINWPGLDQFSDYEWYVEISDGGNTTTGPVWTFTTPANSPLPVNIISFKAKAENNSSVKISWTTTYERDNSHFEIQRSVNAINYITIGVIQGVNNSNSLQEYTFYDMLPLKGISFYRLKQVDTDNRFSFSKVDRINLSTKDSKIEIFPNPISGNSFTIKLLNDVSGNVDVRIFDMKGSIQLHQQYTNSNNIMINHSLAPGIYSILVTTNEMNEAKKIIVH